MKNKNIFVLNIILIIILIVSLIIACQSTIPVQTAQRQINLNLFANKNNATIDKDITKIKSEIEKLDIRITNNNIIDLDINNDLNNLKLQVEKLENQKDNNFIVAIESIIIAIFSCYKLITSIKNKSNQKGGETHGK